MKTLFSLSCALCVVKFTEANYYFNTSDGNVDPASWQLFDYKGKTPIPELLTTSSGQPVYVTQTNTLNSNLLNNPFLIETIKHAVNERRPDREAFPKGGGARGYFIVTHDITKYTKARLFEKVGKKTPVFVRFSIAQVEKGSSDLTTLAAKGLAVKFYTEQGNLDLISVNVPVFLFRDPIVFRTFAHSFRPNPKTNLRDANSFIDFLTLHPVALHSMIWVLSGFGLPQGFRYMNAFPCHTFQLYNEHGESYFVRFKWLTDLGFKSFSLEEASAISSFDPDFFMRDLYNTIERKKYPSWTLKMDVLIPDPKQANFDPFDTTNIWPNGTYHTEVIGRLVLNENVENFFADVEQSAFNPSNLVPGIIEPPDQLFRGRVIAYTDAQIYRLGVNRNKIKVNCPLYAKTYNRDGKPPVADNEKDTVNYYPNYFHGPVPYLDAARPRNQLIIQESSADDLEPSRRFYNEVTQTDAQKQRLVDNLAQITLRAHHVMQQRLILLLKQIDLGFAERYIETMNRLKRTVKLPNVVEDVDSQNPNPFNTCMCPLNCKKIVNSIDFLH